MSAGQAPLPKYVAETDALVDVVTAGNASRQASLGTLRERLAQDPELSVVDKIAIALVSNHPDILPEQFAADHEHLCQLAETVAETGGERVMWIMRTQAETTELVLGLKDVPPERHHLVVGRTLPDAELEVNEVGQISLQVDEGVRSRVIDPVYFERTEVKDGSIAFPFGTFPADRGGMTTLKPERISLEFSAGKANEVAVFAGDAAIMAVIEAQGVSNRPGVSGLFVSA